MSVHEIREKCMRVEMLTTRVTEFLEKRLADLPVFANGQPTVTISLTPLLIERETVVTQDQKLRHMIRDWSLNDGYLPRPCITGLEMNRLQGMRLRLDRNGHLDLWLDISGDIVSASDQSPNFRLLRVVTVRDHVIGLYALGKQIYEYCDIREPLIAKLDFWNIRGISVRGARTKLGFAGEPQTWNSANLNLDPMEVDSLLDPDGVARIILQRLGEAFGFDQSPFL